jgi:hypothetical protein
MSPTRWRRSQPQLTPELKITLEETLRRHATKPQAAEYGLAEMRDWYRDLDLLPSAAEHIITEELSSTRRSTGSWPTPGSPAGDANSVQCG